MERTWQQVFWFAISASCDSDTLLPFFPRDIGGTHKARHRLRPCTRIPMPWLNIDDHDPFSRSTFFACALSIPNPTHKFATKLLPLDSYLTSPSANDNFDCEVQTS